MSFSHDDLIAAAETREASAGRSGLAASAAAAVVEITGAEKQMSLRLQSVMPSVEQIVADSMTLEAAKIMFERGVKAEVGATVATEEFLSAALAQFLRGLILGHFDLSADLSPAVSFKNNKVFGVPLTYSLVFPKNSANTKRQWGRAFAPILLDLYESLLPANTHVRIPTAIPDHLLNPAQLRRRTMEVARGRRGGPSGKYTQDVAAQDFPGTSDTGFFAT